MRKQIVWIAAVAVLASLPVASVFTSQALGQGQSGGSQSGSHKIGLIDMGYIFKNYKKFEVLREDLKAEIEQSDQQAREMAEKIQQIQAQLQSGDLVEGSPQYTQLEREGTKLATEFDTFRKMAQRDFLRKESQIYKTVYLETVDAVELYAKQFNYTLILRFNREDLDTTDPQKLLQGLNRQVVFHKEDNDITDKILNFLNRNYEKGGQASRPGQPQRR